MKLMDCNFLVPGTFLARKTSHDTPCDLLPHHPSSFSPCNSFATGSPGPLFDAAGVENVGNGHGGQFITGRGKTGCGFEFSKVNLDR